LISFCFLHSRRYFLFPEGEEEDTTAVAFTTMPEFQLESPAWLSVRRLNYDKVVKKNPKLERKL
jgi:hypothetical protein